MTGRKLFSYNGRIAWVDILRFIGMTLIYAGHIVQGENTLVFIYAHHVPLFFFISGFFASAEPTDSSFGAFLIKKIRTVFLPYVIFTFIFYGFSLIVGELEFSELGRALIVSAAGIRNRVPGPLWFFTCLFVVSIAFEVIKRLLNLMENKRVGRALTLVTPVLFFIAGITLLPHEPTQTPMWIWNVDSAMVYILYYAIGAFAFPLIKGWKYSGQSTGAKGSLWICFATSLALAVYTLSGGAELINFLGMVLPAPVFEIYAFVYAMILIFMEVMIARILALVPGVGTALAFAGKDSLYLCGNEMIIKYIMHALVSSIGLTALLGNDVLVFIYSIVCIFISVFSLNLIERLIFGRLFRTA